MNAAPENTSNASTGLGDRKEWFRSLSPVEASSHGASHTTTAAQLRALWSIRTWPESARALGMLAFAVLLALAPHVVHMPIWIPLCVIGATLWRLWIEVHAGALPNKWLRNGVALLAMGSVALNFRTLNGLEAGTALLGMMAGMKLLESRSTRDYSIVIFLALFLLFAELLFEQNILLLPYLLLCTTLIVTCLLRLHDGGAQLSYGAALKRTARMLLQAVPLAALLFLFVPRLPGQFWVMPSRGAATSGLSEQMSLGDVSNLSLSSEVAFRVEFEGEVPPAHLRYWRAVVLHEFDGKTWRRRRGEMFMPQPVIAGAKTYRYRMLLEPSNLQWVPALDALLQTDLRRSFITSDMQLFSFRPITKPVGINMVSATEYQVGLKPANTMMRVDVRLPSELNPRARDLAIRMRAASNDDAAYMRAVLTLFRREPFYYTLEPPPLGRHTVDDFLFTTRRGFCEHFASAFTFLMRAAGVPARVVTGYQGGELNPISDYLVVRQSDAHAWSEVWLAGRGWVRVDPTAAIAPQRIERGLESAISESESVPGRALRRMPWMYQLQQNWDALNTFWIATIVNFDSDDQQAVLARLGIQNADWRALGTALLLAFVGFFIAMAAWLGWRYRPQRRDPATEAYAALQLKLAKAGVNNQPHEGPVDYLSRAATALPALAPQLDELREVYVGLRYHPQPSAQALSRLRHLVNQLRV